MAPGSIKNPAAAGWLNDLICGQGSGVTPDSCEAILRSRQRPNYRQLPTSERRRENPPAAEIVCQQYIAGKKSDSPPRRLSTPRSSSRRLLLVDEACCEKSRCYEYKTALGGESRPVFNYMVGWQSGRVPHLRRSIRTPNYTQPFRAGLTFGRPALRAWWNC
jgi:hypothetical protein